jgi:hypothetical protein
LDSDTLHIVNNCKDREYGVELAKDKIDSKAYYACFQVLSSQKISNVQDWRSWDTGYKNSIAIPKHQTQRSSTPSIAASSLSNESKEDPIVDEVIEIQFEKWC